jgi:hypothetical protein
MSFFPPTRFDKLNRDSAARRASSSMGRARGVLTLHVDKGLELLGQWSSEKRHTATSHVALLLYHALLESVDSADILISAGAAGTAAVQARTAMETAASILYLLKRNNEVVSAACLLSEQRQVHRRQASIVSDARQSGASAEVLAVMEQDLAGLRAQMVRLENLDHNAISAARELDRVEEMLDAPELARWYMVVGGPRSIRQLFATLGEEQAYNMAFRPWSEAAHGRSVLQRYGPTLLARDAIPFRALRHADFDDFANVIACLEHFMRHVTMAIVTYMNEAKGSEYARWLVVNVDPAMVRLLAPRNQAAIEEAENDSFMARVEDVPANRRQRRAMKKRSAG